MKQRITSFNSNVILSVQTLVRDLKPRHEISSIINLTLSYCYLDDLCQVLKNASKTFEISPNIMIPGVISNVMIRLFIKNK